MSILFNPLTFVKSKINSAYSAVMHELHDYSQVISFCVSPKPFDVTGYFEAKDFEADDLA